MIYLHLHGFLLVCCFLKRMCTFIYNGKSKSCVEVLFVSFLSFYPAFIFKL